MTTDADLAAARIDRLRRALAASGPEALRAGVRDAPELLRRRLHVAARVRHPALVRHADPWSALGRADAPSLVLLAQTMTADSLEAAIEHLGASSDDPTVEELRGCVDALVDDHGAPAVALLLASVAAGGNPAAAACDEVLATDDRLALPDEPVAARDDDVGGSGPERERGGPSEEERERRRARRQEQRDERAKQKAARERAAQALRDAKRRSTDR
ncbi:MAG TPA: hypothetical protein VM262_05830 [Acidimicrobiales bacterium]|nr:hypothetical protein [Acidimicrobiales bacterium]